jgi:glutaredoxin
MKLPSNWTVGLLLLACAGTAGAQMYKWKDARGVTHFSDTPPPASAAAAPRVELKYYGDTGSSAALPYELAEATKNHPVTLYTTARCEGCSQGRAMLVERGIPYTEKTVGNAADQAALKQAGGSTQLPLLLVGAQKFTGYDRGAWDEALNAAAYPSQRQLPSDYRLPPPTPAAPRPERAAAPAKAAPAAPGRGEQLPPIKPATDFQF